MTHLTLKLIVAHAHNHVIGFKGTMPWYIPEELQYFKRLTTGCPVIMGRVTWNSILQSLGKPLPNRHSIVLSRHLNALNVDNATVVNHLSDAVKVCHQLNAPIAWIIGGANVYEQALQLSELQECHVTDIDATFEGDAWFPSLNPTDWQEHQRIHHAPQAPSFLKFDTVIYHKK